MAHEMGQYVLNHALSLTLAFTLVLGFGYWVVSRLFGIFQRRHGERWRVRDLADPAGLPLALAIFSVVMLLLTPLTNSIVRTAERQADAFGLGAAKEPHGFASVAMRLASYPKIEPSPLGEIVVFDHRTGRARDERAMHWLAEHPRRHRDRSGPIARPGLQIGATRRFLHLPVIRSQPSVDFMSPARRHL